MIQRAASGEENGVRKRTIAGDSAMINTVQRVASRILAMGGGNKVMGKDKHFVSNTEERKQRHENQ